MAIAWAIFGALGGPGGPWAFVLAGLSLVFSIIMLVVANRDRKQRHGSYAKR